KDALATDLLSSTLAVLLVFLYVKLQLLGLAILVFPLFLVRQLYQMNFQMQLELEEKLELMVKAMEARDPYTSGHSLRVSEYAMATDRPYRRAMNLARALEELQAFAGRQFDPQLVKLVSKSTSIRRLLGTERSASAVSETPRGQRPAWAHRLAQ